MRRALWIPLLMSISLEATADSAGQFIVVDVPNAAGTYVTGINAAGETCGYYRNDPTGASHSFVRDAAGRITTFDVPGSAMNSALGINDHGQVVGYWSPDLTGNVEHMYLRDPSGAIATLDVLNYVINVANGINDGGQMVVNAFTEPGPSNPLFRTVTGAYLPVSIPGYTSVYVNGLNNNGVAAGCVYSNGGNGQAFILPMNTPVPPVMFTVPASTTVTCANGINDSKVTVGYYDTGYRGGESSHGFIRYPDGAIDTFDAPDSHGTLILGVNDGGTIVGGFDDLQGQLHGFIGTILKHPRTRPLRTSQPATTPRPSSRNPRPG